MSFRGTFAGVARSGQILMSRATKGLEMLVQALAIWPILETTWEGEPRTNIDPKCCKIYGYPPKNDAEYYQGQWSSLEGPDTHCDSSEESVQSHPQWCASDEDRACYMRYDD